MNSINCDSARMKKAAPSTWNLYICDSWGHFECWILC